MNDIIKLDDPTIKRYEVIPSQNPKFRIRRSDCPFNENARIVISRNKRKSGIKMELTLDNGIVQNGDWLEVEIDFKKLSRHPKVYFEFDGYGNGGRQMIFEIIINKSAL